MRDLGLDLEGVPPVDLLWRARLAAWDAAIISSALALAAETLGLTADVASDLVAEGLTCDVLNPKDDRSVLELLPEDGCFERDLGAISTT